MGQGRAARRRMRRGAMAGLALALVVGGVACGGDDDDAAKADGAGTAGEAGNDLDSGLTLSATACDAYVGFSQAMAGGPDELGAAASTLTAAVPDGLAATVTTLSETMADGNPEAMSTPEFTDAAEDLGSAVYEGCDATQVDVTGVDYGFDGFPEEVEAGRTAIRFTNGTTVDEPHEMVLFRRKEGTTQPIDELLALPEDEAMSKLEMSGVTFAMTPGARSVLMTELEAGDYVAVCMLPTGGDGPPHAMSGMTAEFTVA